MEEQLIVWVIITLVPLIPTYVTHKFLESSSAYSNTNSGIKLGGAIAAYFILVTAGFYSYNTLNTSKDILQTIRESIRGNWECSGIIIDSEKIRNSTTLKSTMNVRLNEAGKISLSGLTQNEVFWDAEEVIITTERLIYIFNVPLTSATGITWLRFIFNKDNNIDSLHGHWVVSGSKGRGSITCSRKN